MVVSKKPALLQTAATWIKRLDRADTARTSVHVYRVKYGDARQIARVLTDMFTGGSSSGLLDSADSQLAPGAGTYAASSDRLSLNNNNGSSSSGGFGSRGQSGTRYERRIAASARRKRAPPRQAQTRPAAPERSIKTSRAPAAVSR